MGFESSSRNVLVSAWVKALGSAGANTSVGALVNVLVSAGGRVLMRAPVRAFARPGAVWMQLLVSAAAMAPEAGSDSPVSPPVAAVAAIAQSPRASRAAAL